MGQTLLDDASSSFRPGTNRYSPAFTFTNAGRSNRKGCLARGTDNAAPKQPVPPHTARAFQKCVARRLLRRSVPIEHRSLARRLHHRSCFGAEDPPAIAGASLLGDRSSGQPLSQRPSSSPRPSLGGIDPSEPWSEADRTAISARRYFTVAGQLRTTE